MWTWIFQTASKLLKEIDTIYITGLLYGKSLCENIGWCTFPGYTHCAWKILVETVATVMRNTFFLKVV